MLWFILVPVAEGLVVGALARLALPGPDPMGILAAVGLGLAGTCVVGVVAEIRPLTGPGAHQLPPRR